MAGLGDMIRAVKKTHRVSLGDLTVLSNKNDPFRIDTPANHARAKWLKDLMTRCGFLEAYPVTQIQAIALRDDLDEAMSDLREAVEDVEFEVPEFVLPEPVIDEAQPEPLVSSDMHFIEHVRVLRDRKDYGAAT